MNGDGPARPPTGVPALSPAAPLRHRVRLLVLVPLVLVVLSCTACVTSAALAQRDEDRLAEQLAPARLTVDRLDAALLVQQSAFRGFVISGQPSQREGWEDSSEVDGALAALRTWAAADPVSAGTCDQVARLHRRWLSAAGPIVQDRAAGRIDQALSAVPTISSPLFVQLRAGTVELRSLVDGQVAAARDDALRAGHRAMVSAVVALLASVAAGLVVAVGLRRALVRPFERLAAAVEPMDPVDPVDPGRGLGAYPDDLRGPQEAIRLGAALRMWRTRDEQRAARGADDAAMIEDLRLRVRDGRTLRQAVTRRLNAVGLDLRRVALTHPAAGARLSAGIAELDDISLTLARPPDQEHDRTDRAD